MPNLYSCNEFRNKYNALNNKHVAWLTMKNIIDIAGIKPRFITSNNRIKLYYKSDLDSIMEQYNKGMFNMRTKNKRIDNLVKLLDNFVEEMNKKLNHKQ